MSIIYSMTTAHKKTPKWRFFYFSKKYLKEVI